MKSLEIQLKEDEVKFLSEFIKKGRTKPFQGDLNLERLS